MESGLWGAASREATTPPRRRSPHLPQLLVAGTPAGPGEMEGRAPPAAAFLEDSLRSQPHLKLLSFLLSQERRWDSLFLVPALSLLRVCEPTWTLKRVTRATAGRRAREMSQRRISCMRGGSSRDSEVGEAVRSGDPHARIVRRSQEHVRSLHEETSRG